LSAARLPNAATSSPVRSAIGEVRRCAVRLLIAARLSVAFSASLLLATAP
jgi:hypothetical protein